jgi:hypothetical protein
MSIDGPNITISPKISSLKIIEFVVAVVLDKKELKKSEKLSYSEVEGTLEKSVNFVIR